MDELEVLFADNRGIICFYVLLGGFLVWYSKRSDIHMWRVFCLSRRRNMEYVRKQGVISIVCFAGVGILLYELLALATGYAHITPALAAFFLAGTAFVVFWLYSCTIANDIGQVVISVFFIVCTPGIVVLAIVKGHVTFDRYLGYAVPVLVVFAAVQYKQFVDAWKKGDLV